MESAHIGDGQGSRNKSISDLYRNIGSVEERNDGVIQNRGKRMGYRHGKVDMVFGCGNEEAVGTEEAPWRRKRGERRGSSTYALSTTIIYD